MSVSVRRWRCMGPGSAVLLAVALFGAVACSSGDGGVDVVASPDLVGVADASGQDVADDAVVPPDLVPGRDHVAREDIPAAPDTANDAGGPVTCGSESPAALAACADEARYEADLRAVVGSRPTGSEGWQTVQDLVATRLDELGFEVERQSYGGGVNVVGTRRGTTLPNELVLVGAHYDHVFGCTGADDNGSGVAGALEVARVLAQADHARTLVVAFWDEEERSLIGSRAFARRGFGEARLVVYFNFEMIGYASSEPGSQTLPPGFELLFPDVKAGVEANESRADFIAAVIDEDAAPYAAAMARHAGRLGLPMQTIALTNDQTTWDALAVLRRSDHASFWAEGYPALMITDTAEFRYDSYHCIAGDDAIAQLDIPFAVRVVGATIGAAAEALAGDGAPAPVGPGMACRVVPADSCGAGRRCSVVRTPDGYGETCLDVTGTKALGEVCTRPTNEPGVDDCGAGLWCTVWGLPEADPLVRVCRPLCTTAADCAADESCMRIVNSPTAGACVPRCDPTADTCGDGLVCAGWLPVDARGRVFACDWIADAPVAAGGGCEYASECERGFTCDPLSMTCHAYCDADSPCASGACSDPAEPTVLEGLGVCR